MEATDKAGGLEIRSAEVRSVDTETRTITGMAVPYGQVTKIGAYAERFEKGAFGEATDVKLFYGHSEPIGRVLNGEDTDEGYLITARISETDRGNEVYTLMRDGVLNRFSVGFMPLEHRMDEEVLVRTKAALKEVSVVAFPAYDGAKVSEVRAEEKSNKKEAYEKDMSNEEIKYAPESDVASLRDSLTDLERRMAMGSTHSEEVKPLFRSGAEFVKALVGGAEEARDFGTTVDADVTRPGWVNERMRLVAENRPIINAFAKGALPASGNSIEYPFVSAVSGTVGVQATEGTDLNYMEVALDTASALVKTYGGYSALSRQSIERSDLAYLETVLEYQVRQYAKATEAAVRTAVTGATGTNALTMTPTGGDTAAKWVDLVGDSSDLIDTNGLGAKAEFAIASPDVWKRLAHMVDGSGRPIFNVFGAGVNNIGSASVLDNALNVAGLAVIKNANVSNGTFIVASSDAVKTFESAGAPFRLTDENIINLTKQYSVYGYMAVAVTNPKGLVKCTVTVS